MDRSCAFIQIHGGWSEPLSYEKLFDDKNKLKHFEDGVVALSLEE